MRRNEQIQRNKHIAAFRKAGNSYRKIAEHFGISIIRVRQIIEAQERKTQKEKRMEDQTDRLFTMLDAQKEAEAAGEQEFTCPLCQGKAKWARAAGNNHLWIQCHDCGFRLRE